MSGAVRSCVIAYGVGLYTVLVRHAGGAPGVPRAAGGGLPATILLGIGLQGAGLAARWAVRRYERAHDAEGVVSPMATYVIELLLDGVTVALFAIGTFRALALTTAGLE